MKQFLLSRARSTGLFLVFPLSVILAGFVAPLWAQGQPARFAYVANCGSYCSGIVGPGNVSAYMIDGATGALKEVAGSPFPAGVFPRSVTVDPRGQFAYVVNSGSNNISAYIIDGTTGALGPVVGSPFPAGFGPVSVTVDPTGQFAYVANGGGNSNVSAFTIDGTTAALTPVVGSPFPAGKEAFSVTVDPTGQFAYVANLTFSGNVSAYTIDRGTGALTEISGSPFPAADGPDSVTVEPTGRFAYVSNNYSSNISAYTIDGTTGALTEISGSPFPAGLGPSSVTVDPTGKFAYAVGLSVLASYTIDGTTGALTPIASAPFFPPGFVPVSVTVDPTGKFAYVAVTGSGVAGRVYVYAIDGTTGALTPVPGSPFPAGLDPESVTTTVGPASVPPRQTVFLISGIGQNGGENGDLKGLAASLRDPVFGIDPSRFVVDAGFDFGYCAAITNCSTNCTIQNGARALALYINQKSPSGDIILVGYSMGGLIARDMILNNYANVVTNHHVAALITLGTPHLGYPYEPIDGDVYLGLCNSLVGQMFGDFRNPASAAPPLPEAAKDTTGMLVRDFIDANGNPVALSGYLSDLNTGWAAGSFVGPDQWFAVGGAYVSNNSVRMAPYNNRGCPDNTSNDTVVCQDSAIPALGGALLRWLDPLYSHTGGVGTLLLFGSGLGSYSLSDPPVDGYLLFNISNMINGLP